MRPPLITIILFLMTSNYFVTTTAVETTKQTITTETTNITAETTNITTETTTAATTTASTTATTTTGVTTATTAKNNDPTTAAETSDFSFKYVMDLLGPKKRVDIVFLMGRNKGIGKKNFYHKGDSQDLVNFAILNFLINTCIKFRREEKQLSKY